MVMHAGSLDNIANPKRLDSAQTPPNCKPNRAIAHIAQRIASERSANTVGAESEF